MKLKREEISRIGAQILKSLRGHHLVTLFATEDKIQAKIESVIFRNLEEEAAIEEQVKKIMEQYRSQIASSKDGAIDPQKAYMMIKKQIAKERKFVL